MAGYKDTRSIHGQSEASRIIYNQTPRPPEIHQQGTIITDIRLPFWSVFRFALQLTGAFLIIHAALAAVFGIGWLILMALFVGAVSK